MNKANGHRMSKQCLHTVQCTTTTATSMCGSYSPFTISKKYTLCFEANKSAQNLSSHMFMVSYIVSTYSRSLNRFASHWKLHLLLSLCISFFILDFCLSVLLFFLLHSFRYVVSRSYLLNNNPKRK